MTAIAAVDTALWDIKGKALGAPVYQLLGGASRDAVMVYGHASGDTIDDTVEAVGALRRARLSGGPRAVQRARARRAPTGSAAAIATSRRERGPVAETALEQRAVSRARCRRSSIACAASSARTSTCCTTSHHRLDADRGGAPRPGARAVRSVLARGSDARREPGELPADSAAHDDAAGRRRGVQLDPRLPAADPGTADRLHPDHRRARGRPEPPAEDRRAGGAARRAHRLARRDRSQPGLPGGGAALRSERAQLRDPGIHAALGRHRPRLSARLHVRRRRRCIPATRRASAWTSTRRWPRPSRISAPIFPSRACMDGTMHDW